MMVCNKVFHSVLLLLMLYDLKFASVIKMLYEMYRALYISYPHSTTCSLSLSLRENTKLFTTRSTDLAQIT